MSTRSQRGMNRRSAWLRGATSRLGIGLLLALAPACAAEPGALEPIAATVDPLAWVHQKKLFAQNQKSLDRFGLSVAASGDTIVVSSRFGNGDVVSSGAAYVFARNGAEWLEQAKLPTPVEATSGLGGKVAVSGDTIVVGATSDNGMGEHSGAAYVFVRNDSLWTPQARLLALDGAPSDIFGNSVAISGETIVVGASRKSDSGDNSGAAYVFVRSDGAWTQQKKLVPENGKAGDYFGSSVAISGETIVVGAPGRDDIGLDSGAAYAFTRSGVSWSPPMKLSAPGVTEGDRFGYAVAGSNDTIVVAADGDDDNGNTNVGAAYVFARSGASWGSPQRLLAGDRMSGYRFGISVAVSGETIVVGAGNDTVAKSAAAYVFARSGEIWSQQEKLSSVGGTPFDRFGVSVAVSGDTVAVGATYDDDIPKDSGTVHVFRLRFDNGEPCVDADKCLSGFCVDQVCCYSACDQAGMACSASKKGWGNDGICGAIAEGSVTGAGDSASMTGAGGAASVTGAGGSSAGEKSYYSCAAAPGRGPGSFPMHLLVTALALAVRSTRRRRAARRDGLAR